MIFRFAVSVFTFLIGITTVSASEIDDAMILAVQGNNALAVSTLVIGGASVNAPDDTGLTPLAHAALTNAADAARILLASGGQPWTPDQSKSPVAIAALSGAHQTLEVLLSKGVPPTVYNDTLELAALLGDPAIIQTFLYAVEPSYRQRQNLGKEFQSAFDENGYLRAAFVIARLEQCKKEGNFTSKPCLDAFMLDAVKKQRLTTDNTPSVSVSGISGIWSYNFRLMLICNSGGALLPSRSSRYAPSGSLNCLRHSLHASRQRW